MGPRRHERVTKKCEFAPCGATFSAAAREGEQRRYCSQACAAKASALARSAPRNSHKKGAHHQDKKPTPPGSAIARFRVSRGETQVDFWRRFGVTQSGGSRYENERGVPRPVRLLLTLYESGALTDDVIERAWGSVERAKRKSAQPS